jgi:hypothetical protein
MRRALIVLFTFLGGLYFFVAFFLPQHLIFGRFDFEWTRYDNEVSEVFQIIFAVAVGLGVINILRVYGYQVVRRRKGWPNGLALIVAMIVTAVAGLWGEYGSRDWVKNLFNDFLFGGLYNNLGSAMFSLLAFYIAGAAYRSFRVHNPEAALMMLAALVVMIGQIPLGFYISERVPLMRNWLMTQVSTPGIRAKGASKAGGR